MLIEKRSFPTSGHDPRSLSVTALAKKITKAKKRYIRWLNQHYPDVLRRALDEVGLSRKQVGLSGMGQAANPAGPGQTSTDSGSEDKAWYDQLLDYVPQAVQAYGSYKQQEELIELNRQRAQQGLEPLNQPPAIKVEGEAGPETRRAVQAGIQGAAAQYIPWVAGGLILWAMTRPTGRKR